MKRTFAMILTLALLLSCAVSLADPITLHVEKENYSLDLTIKDVRIEDGKLFVDSLFENNTKCGVGSSLPMVYAVYNGKEYQAESYSARISGVSSKNMGSLLLSGVTFNIPYDATVLPQEIYAESAADHYELVWVNPETDGGQE